MSELNADAVVSDLDRLIRRAECFQDALALIAGGWTGDRVAQKLRAFAGEVLMLDAAGRDWRDEDDEKERRL